MTVRVGQTEAARRLGLGVELKEHGRLLPDDPRIVSGLENDDRRGREVEGAAVRIGSLDVAAGQEADVCVPALGSADDGFHVGGPAKPRRVDDASHPHVAGTHDVDLDAADVLVVSVGDGGKERIDHDLPQARA